MQFKVGGKCGECGVRKLVYNTNRPAILKMDLVGLSVDGNWQIWVRDCGSEAVSIYEVREGAAGISNLNSLTLSTLELVDEVHRLAVSTCSYRVGGAVTGK